MRRRRFPLLFLVSLCVSTIPSFAQGYGDLPLSFEPNLGQANADVRFLSHGKGYAFFLTDDKAVVELDHRTIELEVANRRKPSRVVGESPLPGTANYFRGADPGEWIRDLSTYAQVRMRDVYPDVDLVYYGNHRQLEYDFIVRPGGDPNLIGLLESGAALTLDQDGSLQMGSGDAVLHWHAPVAYQEMNGRRTEVKARYAVRGSEIRFVIGPYDHSRELVIDPVLVYSTYLGGNGGDVGDVGNAITVDANGNAYVVGLAASTNFPTTGKATQTATHGNDDAFVAKLNPEGTAFVYSTYLGGGGQDIAWSVAVDSTGHAYVTGQTGSGLYGTAAFPTTAGAYQRTHNSQVLNNSVFVTKLKADGSDLLYSTLLSGTNDSTASSIAVDASGSAYVLTNTASGFPVTSGAYQRTAGTHECPYEQFADGQAQVVTKLNATASELIYSTYVGHGCDYGAGIAVNLAGEAYITGYTQDNAYPVTSGAAQTKFGGIVDGFVTRLNASGSGLLYSTLLGGPMADFPAGIALDSAGYAYVAGGTDGGFATTAGAYETTATANPYRKGFVTKVSPMGKALVYSTYIHGATNVEFNGIAVDKNYNAYVTGYTDGKQYPVTSNAVQRSCYTDANGCLTQAVVSKLNSAGNALLYSSYFGASGSGNNYFPGNIGNAIAVDGSGEFYITGRTGEGLRTTSNAVEANYHSTTNSTDAFVAKFNSSASTSTTTKVTILTPADGTTLTSDPLISATATGGIVREMQLYVDGGKKTQQLGAVLATAVNLAVGKHRITVQALDMDGTIAKSTIYVTVK
jgi:hypothetical protein